MKRLFTLLFLLIATAPAFSQIDTFSTSTGYKYWEGKTIQLGTGSMQDGDYKYIRISATSLMQYMGTDRAAVNSANSMPASANGQFFKIIRVDSRGSKKHGYVDYAILNSGITKYQVDVERAIATGELDVPMQFLPANKQVAPSLPASVSPADELAKFKKLLDEGAITQDEYDQQKKKLLNL